MHKLFSLLLTTLILGISLEPGFATHFCRGELAKLVYDNGEAGCGTDCSIPSGEPNTQETSFQKPSCCQYFIFTLSVDEYHTKSQKPIIETTQVKFSDLNPGFVPEYFVLHMQSKGIPPPFLTKVFLPFIQVFLI